MNKKPDQQVPTMNQYSVEDLKRLWGDYTDKDNRYVEETVLNIMNVTEHLLQQFHVKMTYIHRDKNGLKVGCKFYNDDDKYMAEGYLRKHDLVVEGNENEFWVKGIK